MNKEQPRYPIYIVSKGRWENGQTARVFKEAGLDFLIAVEPQEYDQYCEAFGEEYILKLPFSNLGLGSYPARNHIWEHSIKNGYDRHWCFDDNIRGFRRMVKGKRIKCNPSVAIRVVEDFTDRYENVGISGFNYTTFVMPSEKKPFYMNTHVYSAILIQNDLQFRWRLKYNEDVDLCLQALENGICTISMNAFSQDKTSTVVKMKGGNQDELYKNNAFEKKVLKARSLEEVWPNYVETKMRFNRPHHYINWGKHFKHLKLIRKEGIDLDSMGTNEYGLKLVKKDDK